MKKGNPIKLRFLQLERMLIALLAFALMVGVLYFLRGELKQRELEGPQAPAAVDLEDLTPETPAPEKPEDAGKLLNISMPFYTQAPLGNWDYPWQEACEEASVLLVANVYKDLNLSREAFNNELLRLVDWEIEYFGAYEHTTVDQTAEMLKIQYHLDSIVHENPSFEDIQTILNKGHFIIAPFAGKILENPNFTNGGPIYHMLVIKGYNAKKNQIVTHDVGTRNGADYVYSWEVIEEALHDWHDDDILLGTPKIIEVLPPTL